MRNENNLFFCMLKPNLGLNNVEKQLLMNILRDDEGAPHIERMSHARFSWIQMRYAFTDWQVYVYGAVVTGNLAIIKNLCKFSSVYYQRYGPYQITDSSVYHSSILSGMSILSGHGLLIITS